VVDQDGEPLRGVNIVALQVQIEDGIKYTNSVRSVATDDRGMYRMWNLNPGEYFLKAAGKSGGTTRYVGESSPYYSSWQGFAPVYFGGAKTLDSARAIQIGAGGKASADFALALEPAFKIRGTLAGAPSGTMTFELMQGSESVSASRTSLNSSSGKFEVQDVTPGAYTLRVEQEGKMRGEARVTVSDGDVDGVSISLAPAVTVEVEVNVIGTPLKMSQTPGFDQLMKSLGVTGPEDDEIRAAANQVMEPLCTVSLQEPGGNVKPGQRRKLATPLLGVQADGSRTQVSGATAGGTETTIKDLLPGAYNVVVGCQNGYPASVLAGGVDLLDTPVLNIQPGATPAPIEVAVRPGGGLLTGSIDLDPLPEGTGLLLIPTSARSSGPLMMHYSKGMPGFDFGQPFLAPGDYAVYALSDWQHREFRNPAFLKTLSGGVSVHIEDGKETQVTINSIVK